MKPLEPFRDRLTVLSGLANNPPPAAATGAGVHARASTRFLTNIPPKRSDTSEVEAGVSVDQLIAQTLGDADAARLAGGGDRRPRPGRLVRHRVQLRLHEHHRLAGTVDAAADGERPARRCSSGCSAAAAAPIGRRARRRLPPTAASSTRSATAIATLQGRIGARDRAKLGEYLEAVRDIERRIRKAEEQSDRELPLVERPRGVPASFEEHAKLMFDLQLLAYETDLTRVITFMLGRELSGRTFPELGVAESHHATSHHQENKGKIANLLKIKVHHAALFAYYLEKLQATPDGDGSLLDHMMIVYGAGMGDSNLHAPGNLPVMIAGGAAGRIKTGQHVKYTPARRWRTCTCALLDIFGVHAERFGGDSTGPIEQLAV